MTRKISNAAAAIALNLLLPLHCQALQLHLCSSSSGTSFTRSSLSFARPRKHECGVRQHRRHNIVMFDESEKSSKSSMVWSSLAATEKWIQKTLNKSGGSAAPGRVSNPFSRKEVSYDCETSETAEGIVAGVFRRLREMREIGVGHGAAEQELRSALGQSYRPHTFRQTLVVVAPSNEDLTSHFSTFDNLVNAINDARRNARDYVTDLSLEKLDESKALEEEWVTSINLAHLHPSFGMEEKKFFFADEGQKSSTSASVDPKFELYQERKMASRRSPYPSFVIEVRSVPPFQKEEKSGPQAAHKRMREPPAGQNIPDSEKVSKDDVQKLEALFGVSASFRNQAEEGATTRKEGEDAFYDAIGRSSGIDQLTFLSPTDMAQSWITSNDLLFDETSSSFMAFDTKYVDAAYEFVFASIAMRKVASMSSSSSSSSFPKGLTRDYLIMPQFLTKAATSFEKFAGQVENIVQQMPKTSQQLTVSTFHPEHVDRSFRAPVPVVVLTWNK